MATLKVSKLPDGGGYKIDGYVDGERIRKRLPGRTKAQADIIARELEQQAFEAHRRPARDYVPTLHDAIDAYVRDKVDIGGNFKSCFKRARDYFDADIEVNDVTPEMVRAFARTMFPGYKPNSLNSNAIIPIKAVINWTADQYKSVRPIRVPGFRYTRQKRTPIDEAWLETFTATGLASDKYQHVACAVLAQFMAATASRINEALSLEWSDTHLDADPPHAVIRHAKGNRSYTKVIPPYLVPHMRRLHLMAPTKRKGKTFGLGKYHGVRAHWDELCGKAGLPLATPHVVGRHTFATRLGNLGYSAEQIAAMGHWKSAEIVRNHYLHIEADAEQAAQIMDNIWSTAKSK